MNLQEIRLLTPRQLPRRSNQPEISSFSSTTSSCPEGSSNRHHELIRQSEILDVGPSTRAITHVSVTNLAKRQLELARPILFEMSAIRSTFRYGRPWIGVALIVYAIGMFIYVAFFAYKLLSVGPNSGGGFAWINGLFLTVMVLPYLILMPFLLRNPTKMWRVITVTDSELRLPDPKWRHLSFVEVAGVGLGRYQKVLGSTNGSWAPIFWRSDGSHLRVNGLGLETSKKSPEETKAAEAVSEIYRRIAAIQGPSGLLATQALQRKSNLGVSESITSVWDPSSHLSTRDSV